MLLRLSATDLPLHTAASTIFPGMRLMYSSDWSWVWEKWFYSIGVFISSRTFDILIARALVIILASQSDFFYCFLYIISYKHSYYVKVACVYFATA